MMWAGPNTEDSPVKHTPISYIYGSLVVDIKLHTVGQVRGVPIDNTWNL